MKDIRLLFSFYRYYGLAAILITVCCVSIYSAYGVAAFKYLFYLKLATSGLFVYFVNLYKYKEFYYYYNLGFSKTTLWVYTLFFDLLLFIISIIITHNLR